MRIGALKRLGETARGWWIALALALLVPLSASAAWTPVAPGVESLILTGRPTLLAQPGTGSNVAAATAAPRVLVVADESPEGLRFIDPDAGVELGSLATVGRPVALAVDSAGVRVYVLTDNDRLQVVAVATRTLVSTFNLGGNPRALLLRESGGQVVEVLVAQKGPDRVIGVNPATGTTLRSADLDRDPATLAWGLGGTRVLTGLRSGKLYALDAADLAVLSTAQIGDEIRDLSWWEPGGLAVVVHKRTDGVSLVNVTTGQVAAFVGLDGDPERGAVDAVLERLFITTHDDLSVNRVNLATRVLEGRYALPEKAAGSLFDPVSRKLFLSQRGDRKLLKLDPDQASLISVLQLNKRLRDIAVNNVTHEAIAVADKADELTRVKLSDRSAATVQLPARPRFVAVDTVLNVAVVGLKNKQVRFVDLAPAAPALLPESVALPDEPDALAVDATRALAVALTDTKRRIHFVSNATRSLVSSISLAEDADALAIHAGRGLAYVLTDKKKLLLVNLDTRAIAQTIALPFRGNAVAVDEALDRAVITTDQDNKAYVLDLATIGAGTTSLAEAGFAQVHVLPRKPGAVAVQTDRNLAVITSRESNALSAIDLATGTLAASFVALQKPFALAITTRYNQALTLLGEHDEVAFVQLANPVPQLDSIVPASAAAGSPALVLQLNGRRFIDTSRAYVGGTALTTRWLSHTRLEADVPASLLASAAAVSVTVRNPSPAGGESNPLTFSITGGALVLTALNPNSGAADGQSKVIGLIGQGFVSGATVRFGAATLPATFNGATSLTVTVPGNLTQTPGTVQVAVVNPNAQVSNQLPFTLSVNLAITAVAPTSAEVGSTVTLTGVGFDPVPGNNQLTFRGIDNTTAPAAALTATPTQITVRVPPLADTGPITLANSRGTTQSAAFTVTREQDFQLVVSPANLTVYQGASSAAQAQLSSTGTRQFTGIVTLSAQGLPAGVTASFSPATTLSAFQAGMITFGAAAAATPGNYSVTVRAAFTEGGAAFARSGTLNLTVAPGGNVTGVKGRFVTPENQGIAGIIVRADTGTTPQPQTTTDAAGNFTLVGLPAGPVTLRMDATPANPLYPIWPYTTTLTANQIVVLSDWTINPPPPAERFTGINNATQDQIVTDARYPGLAVKLPAGVTITGWDGVVKNRIAVERYDPDKLAVTAPPIPTRSVFQLHFGTPMGGIPSAPIPVTFPNDAGLNPGERTNIWFFDGSPMGGTGEWKIAGQGTVSPDGKVVVPDANAGIPRFCGQCGLGCIQGNQNNNPPPPPPPCCDGNCPAQSSANPVNYAIGQELPSATDLSIAGLIPLEVARGFHPRDPFNNIAGTTLSLGLGWALSYDVTLLPFSGQLVRIITAGNNVSDFTPDGAGGFELKTDMRFCGAKLSPVGNNWELKFKDGRVWRFQQFGVIHRLTEQRDPNGNALLIARDAGGRIQSVQGGQRALSFSYGANGFVSEIRDPLNRSVRFTYTSQSRLETVTAPDNGITRYTYVDDTEFATGACPAVPSGVRLKTIQRPGQNALQELFYGPGHRVLREVLEDGSEVRFKYKLTGACVTHVSSPAVQCQGPQCPTEDSWENFQAGWRISGGTITATTHVDANGRATTFRFGAKGQGSDVTDAQGQSMKFVRDANNRVISRADVLGRTWRYQYDANGNRTKETDPLNRITDTTYDPKWNKPTTITRYLADGTPITVRFEYDINTGNVLRMFDPLNNQTINTYTPQGQVRTVTVPGNRTTTFEHSPAGDLTKIIDPLGNEITFARDLAGRLTRTTDALGFDTQVEYSPLSLLNRVIDARQGITQFNYDAKRNLASVINPLNVPVESYQQDNLGRITQKTDAKTKSDTYQYDGTGNLRELVDRRGQRIGFAYDAQNRPIRIDYPDAAQTRAYDAAGRVVEIREPNSVVTYAYDNVDRVTRVVTDSAAGRHEVAYEYDTLDRVTRRTVNGADPTVYAYDNASRLLTIVYRNQTTTYDWDSASRLIAKTLPNGIRQELAYDNADRLLSITYRKPDNSVIEAVTYTYDANGQRLTKSGGGSSARETGISAVYDGANRLTNLTLTGSGQTFVLSYDDNGNLTSKVDQGNPGNITTYTWDSRNRLSGINAPGVAASFGYDPLGRRIEKSVNGQTIGYVYDDAQVIGEVVGGTISATILAGLAIDEVIARHAAGGNRTYLTDALGSVLAVTRDDQSIQSFYAYTPYGESAVLGPDEGNPIQYTARENDQTGLYFYRARYYDPVLKQFLSEDPPGIVAGINLRTYVGGNPVTFKDPTGEWVWVAAGAIIGAGINVAATYIANNGNVSWQQVAAAAASGAISGAIGSLATPFGGSIAMALGQTARGAVAIGASGAFSAGGAYAGQVAANAIDPCNQGDPLKAALFGGVGGAVGKSLPTTSLNSVKQANIFAPKYWSGLFTNTPNTGWFWGAATTSGAVGAGSNF